MTTPTDVSSYIVNGIFLELFQRQATVDEVAEYKTQVITTGTDQDLQDSIAALKIVLAPPATYNPATSTITLTGIHGTNYNGVTLGNGKIALITSPSYNNMARSIITTSFDFNSFGRYINNVIDTFKYTKFHVDSRDNKGRDIIQKLNMQSGIFNTTYDVITSNNSVINVSHDVAPLRQYPYCTMQTITLSALSPESLDIYHDLEMPDTLIDPVFNTDLITTIKSIADVSARRRVYMFSGTAAIKEGAGNKTMSCVSSYIFADNAAYEHLGYNMMRTNPNNAYNKYNVTLARDDVNVLYTFRFSIITCTMSSYDFAAPDVEARRILVNVTSKSATMLRDEHVAAWLKMWSSNIVVTPKAGVLSSDPTAAAEIEKVNKFIKLSLFNIYGAIRDDINVEINPLNLSNIDFTGHIFFSADLWLLPVLIMLKPRAARTLLDYRYTQLDKARKLAAAHGYAGVRFAYENDNVGYNDVYWDTVSPLYVFNTGLVSVSAWSYYRVTRDLSWLQRKGFEILKGGADFFVSLLEYSDPLASPPGDGKYHTRGVMSMNNVAADDNALTNYLAYEAIQFAIEAAYELNYIVPIIWTTVANAISLPIGSNTVSDNISHTIIETDAAYGQTLPHPKLKLLEPLIMLSSYYSRDFFGFNANYNLQTIKDNLVYYGSNIDPSTENNATNQLLFAGLSGAIAQKELTYLDRVAAVNKVQSALANVHNNAVLQPWSTFTNSLHPQAFNDISVSSMYVFSLLTGLGGLRVAGGVTDARFYYEEMGIVANNANVLPSTWDKMTITGVGNTQATVTITNQLFYVG
jgi:hypothetical protein